MSQACPQRLTLSKPVVIVAWAIPPPAEHKECQRGNATQYVRIWIETKGSWPVVFVAELVLPH